MRGTRAKRERREGKRRFSVLRPEHPEVFASRAWERVVPLDPDPRAEARAAAKRVRRQERNLRDMPCE